MSTATWETLEAGRRGKIQEGVQALLEEEVTELFGRVKSARRAAVDAAPGYPVKELVSTSYVERSNLSLRTHNRRFTRLTNAFSKKIDNHAHAVALHFMVANFCRSHGTLTKKADGIHTTPAMAAGLINHVWKVEEVLDLMNPEKLLGAAKTL